MAESTTTTPFLFPYSLRSLLSIPFFFLFLCYLVYVLHFMLLASPFPHKCILILLRGSLSINDFFACVYIYIRQLSSFKGPTLRFIDLTVGNCHIQYTFLSLCQFLSQENGQNTKILDVRHFSMVRKWPLRVIRRAKH